jgi:hypothetical protein
MQQHLKEKKIYFIAGILLFVVSSSCKQNEGTPLFKQMPASQTGISFQNKLEDKPLFNILYYLYYYNGGGVARGY